MHTDKKLVPRISIYCINQLLREHKIIYKMVSLDKYVEAINTVRQLLSNGINFIDYIKLNVILVNPLSKCLLRDQDNCSSRKMGLKPMSKKFSYW